VVTDAARPWEPPLAGTEEEHLLGALERLRTTFRWKADGLGAAGLQVRMGASSLTLGALLDHLAVVEDLTFTDKLRGESIGEPWESIWRGGLDWPFTSAAEDPPEQLYRLWEDAVARSRTRPAAALADGGLDQPVHVTSDDGRQASRNAKNPGGRRPPGFSCSHGPGAMRARPCRRGCTRCTR